VVAAVAELCYPVATKRIGAEGHPLPFSPPLEDAYLPKPEAVVDAAMALLKAR
jgi:pyruvate/2-oxoglutarate/acetoin dehydrogenase E1 component